MLLIQHLTISRLEYLIWIYTNCVIHLLRPSAKTTSGLSLHYCSLVILVILLITEDKIESWLIWLIAHLRGVSRSQFMALILQLSYIWHHLWKLTACLSVTNRTVSNSQEVTILTPTSAFSSILPLVQAKLWLTEQLNSFEHNGQFGKGGGIITVFYI